MNLKISQWHFEQYHEIKAFSIPYSCGLYCKKVTVSVIVSNNTTLVVQCRNTKMEENSNWHYWLSVTDIWLIQ